MCLPTVNQRAKLILVIEQMCTFHLSSRNLIALEIVVYNSTENEGLMRDSLHFRREK